MYSAETVAGYAVSKCIDDGQPISNLQLQKILYYIQKKYLNDGRIAFADDFEAWQFGPVIPKIYYRYSGYGAMPIDIPETDSDLDKEDSSIIDPIIEEKRVLNPWDMVNDTHKEGSAWYITYQGGKGNHCVIKKDLIREAG